MSPNVKTVLGVVAFFVGFALLVASGPIAEALEARSKRSRKRREDEAASLAAVQEYFDLSVKHVAELTARVKRLEAWASARPPLELPVNPEEA